MELECLGILNLLRVRARTAIRVSVESRIGGAVLVGGLGVGPGMDGVDVEEDVDDWKRRMSWCSKKEKRGDQGNQLTEEEEESDAVEDQDVGYVGDACVVQQKHLFLGGAHEEEAGGIEQLRKRKQVSIILDIPN